MAESIIINESKVETVNIGSFWGLVDNRTGVGLLVRTDSNRMLYIDRNGTYHYYALTSV